MARGFLCWRRQSWLNHCTQCTKLLALIDGADYHYTAAQTLQSFSYRWEHWIQFTSRVLLWYVRLSLILKSFHELIHPITGTVCPVGPVGWNAAVDQLNGAQSGALASNLLHEVNDYLVPRVRSLNIPANAFKYLSLQIGSNDLCLLCAQSVISLGPGSPDDFEANIRNALEAIRAGIREWALHPSD